MDSVLQEYFLKAKTLFITGTCISLVLVTITLFFWLGSANDFNLSRQAAVADARQRAGQPLTAEQKQAQRDWTARVNSQKITQQSIDAAMAKAHESYLAGRIHRVENYLGSRAALTHFFCGIEALGAMLIGMGLCKFGFLTAEKSYATYIWTAALGFLVAAPLYVIGIWNAYTSGFSVLSFDKWICLPYFLNREAGGLSVVSMILLVAKSGVFRTFQLRRLRRDRNIEMSAGNSSIQIVASSRCNQAPLRNRYHRTRDFARNDRQRW